MSEVSVPLWLILGRTRVGKGEFIKTSVEWATGEVINITSNAKVSHTKESARYPLKLNGKDIAFVDTVGFDDSDGDDKSADAFLKLLAETGKEPFYPPLVILRELGGSDTEWLKRVQSVFPSIVCAFRECDSDALESVTEHWANSGFVDVPLFHLQEFVSAKIDKGASREIYVDNVKDIIRHYFKLTPSREALAFDSELFKGTFERVFFRDETTSEDNVHEEIETHTMDEWIKREKVVEVEDGGHYEYKELPKDGVERFVDVIKSILFKQDLTSPTKTVKEWVRDTRKVVVDDSYVQQVTVCHLISTTVRTHYKREVHEIWKVLAGGIRIFKALEYGERNKDREEVVRSSVTKLTDHEKSTD